MKKLFPLILLFVISVSFVFAYFKGNYLLNYDFNKETDKLAVSIKRQLQGNRAKVVIDIKKPVDMEEWVANQITDKIAMRIIENPGIKVVVDENEKDRIRKEIREMMKHDVFYRGSPSDLLTKEEYPEYEITGELKWIKKGKEFQFNGGFTNLSTTEIISLPSYKFFYPEYITNLHNRKKAMEVASLVSSALFTLYLIFLIILVGNQMRIRRRIGEIVHQVDTLIDNKHFVAAEKYLNYALRYDPENPFLNDLKTKLEALSFGDPEKAQVAWEIYKKASDYKEKNMTDKILELSDDIQRYVNYNPELKALSYEIQEHKKAKTAIEDAKALEKTGKLLSALKAIENLKGDEVAEIKNRIQKNIEAIKNKVIKVERMIKTGKPDEAEASIEEILKRNSEDEGIIRIKEILNNAKSPLWIKLIPIEGFGKYYILPKQEIIIGRKEGDIIIPHPMVSNPHLKITVMKRDAIVEDLNSKNHTYVAGEKIKRVSLEDGDVINLARKVKMVAHLCEDTEEGKEAKKTLSMGAGSQRAIGGVILEKEDERWVILRKSCKIKDLGLEFVLSGNYICVKNEKSLMELNGNEILPGDYFPSISGRLKTQEWEYKMEVIR